MSVEAKTPNEDANRMAGMVHRDLSRNGKRGGEVPKVLVDTAPSSPKIRSYNLMNAMLLSSLSSLGCQCGNHTSIQHINLSSTS